MLTLSVPLWRGAVPLETRDSALDLAMVLGALHLGIPELSLVAPAFILTAGEFERSAGPHRRAIRLLLSLSCISSPWLVQCPP